MSERLQNRAEVLKLARLLGVDVADLPALDDVPAASLAEFRNAATDRLFDESARTLGRVGAASKLVPSPIVATIAEKAFGPLLCARAAGAVDPSKAVDVARRLSPIFLADVAIELDPRRVAAIIAAVPDTLVVPVAEELGRREEHVTMGRFLAFVSDDAIVAAMGVLSDEAMLRTAFVLEHKDKLDHAVGLLPADRVPGVLERASELGLWAEALDLLDHLSEERRGPIADTLAGLSQSVVGELVTAVSQAHLWDSLLPIVRLMSPDACARLAAAPAFHDAAVLRSIVEAAAAQDLWLDVVPLIDHLPGERGLGEVLLAAITEADLVATLVSAAPVAALDAIGRYATRAGLTTELDAVLATVA
ncbi:MAG: hypothetical protein WB767_16255 [Nocardioides sp.]